MPRIPSRPGRYLIRVTGLQALTGAAPDLRAVAREVETMMAGAASLDAGSGQAGNEPVVKRLENAAQGLHALSVLLDADAKAQLEARHGGKLLIEPDDEMHLQDVVGQALGDLAPINHFSFTDSLALTFDIVGRDGKPLAGVAVEVHGTSFLASDHGLTDARGRVKLLLPGATIGSLRRLVIRPVAGHWGVDVDQPALQPAASGVNRIELDPLFTAAGESITWGLELMGLDRAPVPADPAKVRVAIIDSGLSADHQDLAPTGGWDFNPSDAPERTWSADGSGHGTHVAGICAALENQVGIVGAAAPGADLFGLRVFPEARVSKIVMALDWCIENRIDVVNMSLGSSAPNETLREAVTRAVEAGVVVVAAAGNSGQRVMFPAAFDGVIAVAALGDAKSFPPSSPHRRHMGTNRDGSLFAAAFTCSGPEIDVIAPGVAVISTVPGGGHAAWDGTSMACPFVTGFVARLLQTDAALRTAPRNRERGEAVAKLLRGCCRPLALPRELQGAGLPTWPARSNGRAAPAESSKAEVLSLLERAMAMIDRHLAVQPTP